MTTSEKVMLGFVATFMSSALWPNLPSISLIAVVLFIFILNLYWKLSALLFGSIVGFIWACFCAYYYLHLGIGDQYFNQNLIVEGKISSLVLPSIQASKDKHSTSALSNDNDKQPTTSTNKTISSKFNFTLHRIGNSSIYHSPNIRLTWFGAPNNLKQGQELRLFIKLKRPVGLANPNGYNYQQWLVSKSLYGLAYVIDSPSNLVLDSSSSLRQALVDNLLDNNMVNMKWMLALSYGERGLFEKSDWELIQRTGTAHLFAISGMHLGIVFGFVLFVINIIGAVYARLITRPVKTVDLRMFKYTSALIICLVYAMLAGYEIPVMRAWFALSLWTILICMNRHWRNYSLLLTLLTLFFLINPYSILGISFWFSFGAVVLIMFFLWRFPYPSKGSFIAKSIHIIKLQLCMSAASTPVILLTFDVMSSSAFVANIVMIPIVTFVLVPAGLIVSCLSILQIDHLYIYFLMDMILNLSFQILYAIDSVDANLSARISRFLRELPSNWYTNQLWLIDAFLLTPGMLVIACIMLLPNWFQKGKLLSTLFLLQISNVYIQTLNEDKRSQNWTLHVFDVGQGTAIVVQSDDKYLLYDTGNAYGTFSMASSVLLPFFEIRKVDTLQVFVLSHFDQDHAGGLNVIKKHFSIKQFLSPNHGCYISALQNLRLEQLKIEVLWPIEKTEGHENNQSCVLKISDGRFSVLLTGDIEKRAEAQMLALYKDTQVLQADVLFAPHHGSKTSSTQAFIEAVSPEIVIYTSGYNNRWGFPHEQVIERYAKAIRGKHVDTQFVTGRDGRILLSFTEQQISVSRYRQDEYKRWFFKAQ